MSSTSPRRPLAEQVPGMADAGQEQELGQEGRLPPATSAPAPSADLVPTEQAQMAKWGTGGGIGWLAELERIAAATAKAVTTPDALGRDPRNVLAVMLTGRELGIGPMESLRLIHIVKGVPVLAAELKVKLARRAGHRIRLVEGDENRCTVVGVRADTEESHEVTWTVEDAKRAKLPFVSSKGEPLPWTTYPRQMLWARAVSQLIRELMPDVTGASLYSAEEISEA